jgi:hypothetical protein
MTSYLEDALDRIGHIPTDLHRLMEHIHVLDTRFIALQAVRKPRILEQRACPEPV